LQHLVRVSGVIRIKSIGESKIYPLANEINRVNGFFSVYCFVECFSISPANVADASWTDRLVIFFFAAMMQSPV
jgi:hypothetical protein